MVQVAATGEKHLVVIKSRKDELDLVVDDFLGG